MSWAVGLPKRPCVAKRGWDFIISSCTSSSLRLLALSAPFLGGALMNVSSGEVVDGSRGFLPDKPVLLSSCLAQPSFFLLQAPLLVDPLPDKNPFLIPPKEAAAVRLALPFSPATTENEGPVATADETWADSLFPQTSSVLLSLLSAGSSSSSRDESTCLAC